MDFPIVKTKIENMPSFDLSNPEDCEKYFELEVKEDIKKIKNYLEHNSFIVYLLGKKNSGKGTYAKIFRNLMGTEKISHFSIGDMIRGIDEELKDKDRREELISFLKKNYRGWVSLDDIIDQFILVKITR